ncbi:MULTISPECIES: hypothetical protein [unclassified Burkholderia]|uniref:hypothetical protein n=1 Tax=unclassified Burkholderia TaxID=2613784 RepID=UPI000A47AAD8|nr:MULTISPECIES: hypothetical protein [unclassified Burkholderia]
MIRVGVNPARSVEVPHSYERVLSTSTTSDVDDDWVSQAVKVDAARAVLRTWKTSVEDMSALNASDVWMRSSRTILKSAVTIWSSVLTIDASGAESSETAMFSELSRAKGVVASYEKAGRPQLASFYLVYFIEQSFRHRSYAMINRLLKEAEVKELTEYSIIAMLRSSFSARQHLPAWRGLLNSARRELDNRGHNAAKLLRGLDR